MNLGTILVNDIFPEEYRNKGPLTKKNLHDILASIAKKYPDQYPQIVTKLKHLGDELATLEGISVGLDDIEPDYAARDQIMKPASAAFKAAKTRVEKIKVLGDAQDKILNYTKSHPGSLTEMARSGGRGNFAQLMRIVGSPVLATDEKELPIPWLITKSYAEGLKPSELWVAGSEARVNAIKSNLSVTQPGDLSKIMINNMSDKLITVPDCGTHNGISMSSFDHHVVDRYLAKDTGTYKRNTLITPRLSQELHKTHPMIIVRSPMTCEAHNGVCQKCHGLDSYGNHPTIGINVGLRAAQSLAEPLTQLALNAKHGGRISTREIDTSPTGITGLRQLIEIPGSFLYKATLADEDGTVTKIDKAPQGGTYVWVNDKRHYIIPDLHPVVKVNQKLEAGDALSDGVPKPDEVVKHKGLGIGRQYMVDTLHKLYTKAGNDIDKRHLEILAKSLLNHVEIQESHDDHDHEFLKGDIVNYNKYLSAMSASQKNMALDDAHGETLSNNTLHFTAGTRLTPSVIEALKKQNIKNVNISTNGPKVEFIMRPATRSPLMNPDWMARLGHRYLKDTILSGAARGDKSDLHGYHPVPAYARGAEFGKGSDGKY